jgi:hypothetical protein
MRDLLPLFATFGMRARASFSTRATNARNPAGVGLRGARAAAARSIGGITLAKRWGPAMSLRRPTIR